MRLWIPLALVLAYTVAGLDLPVEPPTYSPAQEAPKLPAPVHPEREDDPRPHDWPPPVLYGEELGPAESLVYVLDTSCSMYLSRMRLAKSELRKSIAALSPNLRFGIVEYGCLISSWRPELVRATPGAKQSAYGWIEALSAGGSTATGPATVVGLAYKPDALALLTDGQPNCVVYREEHRPMIRRANVDRVPITVFGISLNGSTYAREFCLGVAADSGGSYVDVR